MAIEKKLIHFGKLADFETQLNAGNILDYSIVFIQDAKKIWTHGSYYDCSDGGGNSTYYLTRFSFSDLQTGEGVQNAGKSELIQAIRNGAMIFLPYVSDMPEYGYIFAQAYAEDLLYITISHGRFQYDISTPIDTESIDASEIEEITIQDKLVSGTNIKTINGKTVLGSGDLQIPTGDNNVQADWNVSDTTSDSYIKNRTHYAEFSRVSIPLTINNDSWTEIGLSGIVGQTLYVRYSYPPSNIVASATLSMDDLSVERTLNNGPTFTIYRGINSIYIKGFYDENHILEVTTVVNKLPEYFIPSNIARTSELSNKQDKLVSGTNIKTINGESILGSGDITISGSGSSSSSVAAYRVIEHNASDTTTMISPNVFHVWGPVSSLTIILGGGPANYANEYLFQFTSGSAPTTLSLPDDIKWANDSAPIISANKIYQISVLRGLAACLEFGYNAKTLITFNIDSTEATALQGVTWSEWIGSEYDELGYIIVTGSNVKHGYTQAQLYTSSGNSVKGTDVIEPITYTFTNPWA